jgi:hypothetical protein
MARRAALGPRLSRPQADDAPFSTVNQWSIQDGWSFVLSWSLSAAVGPLRAADTCSGLRTLPALVCLKTLSRHNARDGP